jgi:hypothetical protein
MRVKANQKQAQPPAAQAVSNEEQLIAQSFYLRNTIVQLQQNQANLMRQNADLTAQVSELNSLLMQRDMAPHMQMLISKGLLTQEPSSQPSTKVQPISPESTVAPVQEVSKE